MTGISINIPHIPPKPISLRLESKNSFKTQFSLIKSSTNNQRGKKSLVSQKQKHTGFLSKPMVRSDHVLSLGLLSQWLGKFHQVRLQILLYGRGSQDSELEKRIWRAVQLECVRSRQSVTYYNEPFHMHKDFQCFVHFVSEKPSNWVLMWWVL